MKELPRDSSVEGERQRREDLLRKREVGERKSWIGRKKEEQSRRKEEKVQVVERI